MKNHVITTLIESARIRPMFGYGEGVILRTGKFSIREYMAGGLWPPAAHEHNELPSEESHALSRQRNWLLLAVYCRLEANFNG